MKIKSLCLVFVTFFVCCASSAQEDPPKPRAIKTNLLNYLWPTPNFRFERDLSAKRSLQFHLGYTPDALAINGEMSGWVIMLEYRIYGPKRRKSRNYIAPYLRYQHLFYDSFDGSGRNLFYFIKSAAG